MKFHLKYKPYEPWDPKKSSWLIWYDQLQDAHRHNDKVIRNREKLMNAVLIVVGLLCLFAPLIKLFITR